MAKVKKICRICGKEYTPCGYCENDKMAFHYRTICCSRECAIVYFARVEEARGRKIENTSTVEQAMKTIASKSDNNKKIVKKSKAKPKVKNISEGRDVEQIEESVGTSN